MSDLKEAYIKRYIARTPCYNSIINYLEMEELTPYLKGLIAESALPLKSIETDFAIDSSGFSTSRYTSWYSAKYGKEMEGHDWIKAHLMCGVKTNIVTSVEISGAYAHDTNFFSPLMQTTAKRFEIGEVSADKAYSNRANLTVAENKGAHPYTLISERTRSLMARTMRGIGCITSTTLIEMIFISTTTNARTSRQRST